MRYPLRYLAATAILPILVCLAPAKLHATPNTPTPLTPIGVTADSFPTFTWSDTGGSWYHVYVAKGPRLYFQQWVEGDTSLPAGAAMPAGEYTWWVRAWDPSGLSGWSDAASFQIPEPIIPETPVLSSPSGPLDERSPVFQWSGSQDTEWYWVILKHYGVKYYEFWSQETSWTPFWSLHSGDYTWQVRAWSPAGFSAWTDATEFEIVANPPAAPAPIGPVSELEDTPRPVFSWESTESALWYQVAIQKGGILYHLQWTQQTSLQTDWDFTGGAYTWQVRAWNQDGLGDWSESTAFELTGLTPDAPVLIAPGSAIGGEIEEMQPTFSWNAVADADWYWLTIRRNDQTAESVWLTGTSWTPEADLESGEYSWTIKGWNASGLGQPATFQFTLSSPGGESFYPNTKDGEAAWWRYRINGGNPMQVSHEGASMNFTWEDFTLTVNPDSLLRSGNLNATITGDVAGTANIRIQEDMVSTQGATLIESQDLYMFLDTRISQGGLSVNVDVTLDLNTSWNPHVEWFLDRNDLDELPLEYVYDEQGTVSGYASGTATVDMGIFGTQSETISSPVTSAETWTIKEKLPSYRVNGVTYTTVVKVLRTTLVPSPDMSGVTPAELTYWVAEGVGMVKGIGQFQVYGQPLTIELLETNLSE